jgi:methylphosphotriester-DNA--protein-cysteine methyltransferase
VSIIVSMSLDFAECDQARLARDPSYDGRFYTGVHTTGIYCRPVCPVRPARSANVSFFPSAAGRQLKERCGLSSRTARSMGRGLPSNASLCASV